MNDIMKCVQALKDYNILLKGLTKTIENETKKQKGGFLQMLEWGIYNKFWLICKCWSTLDCFV